MRQKKKRTWARGSKATARARRGLRSAIRGDPPVAQKAENGLSSPASSPRRFDEGKYKSWYTMGPRAEPEPYSTKERILPGYNAHIAMRNR